MSSKHALHDELAAAGAKPAETKGLLEVAHQLRHLRAAKVSQPRRRWRFAPAGVAAVVGLVLGANLIAYAQTSLPGSWLYPVKRLSERVAVSFDPNYRATLMMRRSEEVAQLVNHRASSPVVLATLADYRTDAAAYKSANYAAFEYCKSNLKQAAAAAPKPQQQAIDSTLTSLQT
ncbi:MAG TPA: hypothetical protein VIJ68_03285 [Candidatus Saccharimonadales bacterium]